MVRHKSQQAFSTLSDLILVSYLDTSTVLLALFICCSPQKLCHQIAVTLDSDEQSPFYKRIKRLGVSTQGRYHETITQATFVEALLPYISINPKVDRNLYLQNKKPKKLDAEQLKKVIFGNLFVDGKDNEITDIVWNYFEAVRERWSEGWNGSGTGHILNKTNGYRALMKFLRPLYLKLTGPGGVPSSNDFLRELNQINIASEEFNIDNFVPGSSGEARLVRSLVARRITE